MDPTDQVGALARWHTEPYDPELDEAPEGGPDDCTGETEEDDTDG